MENGIQNNSMINKKKDRYTDNDANFPISCSGLGILLGTLPLQSPPVQVIPNCRFGGC